MRRNVRRAVGVCVGVLTVCAAPLLGAANERHSSDESLYSAAQYQSWIDYLASDALEGRGTGQVGNDEAADFVASTWESFGVEPAGDDNSFFQNFQLALDSKIGDGTRLAIGTRGRLTRKPAILHDEFVPLPFSADGEFDGDVVFAGYGIVDDETGYNDYADVDVKDRIVLVLRRGPDFHRFGIQHISFRSKADAARDHGASALMIVNRDGNAGLYEFHGRRRGDYGLPMLHITPELANKLLAAGGLQDIQTLQDRIERTQAPASAVLDGVSIRGRVEIEPIYSDVRNVVGMIPGTGPQKDQMIVLGAHYDHLGIRHKGEKDFDSTKDIYNGADDNASGTSMLMQLAKTYTQGEAPNRTLVLVAFTGEELGLLGSAHFAKDPTVDLNDCIAMLNFDMVGRLKNDILEIGGMRTGHFQSMVDRLAEPYGLDIRDGGGGRGPSDHTSFYMRDIPVLFFFTGLHKQYHQPTDDSDLINADGAMEIARFASDVIDAIDSNAKAPEFEKDTRRARVDQQRDWKRRQAAKPGDKQAERAPAREDEPVRLGVMLAPSDRGKGLLVDSVMPDTPASAAGIRGGDWIVQIGKYHIESIDDAANALGTLHWGDGTKVRVLRNEKEILLDVRFGKPKETARAERRERSERRQRVERREERRVERREGRRTQRRETKAGTDRLDGALVDRLVEYLKAHDAERKLSSINVGRSNRGFEITATVQWDADKTAVLGDVIRFIGETIDAHEKRSGQSYEYTVDMAMHYANGGDSTIALTIRVGHADGDRAHGHASPHAANPHAGASPLGGPRRSPHGETMGRNPHQAPAVRGRPHGSPHGDDDKPADDVENTRMPPVTLGIMPTYGPAEGEGFEIAGVVDGGAAQRGGMRDKDRILSIGGKKVVDVYSYMDALRKFKPGDKVDVVVLRDGKHVELTIVTAPPRTREPS